MKKLSMSLLLLIIMILLISAVSAAELDENEDSALSQDESTDIVVESSVDDAEIVADSGDGNFTSLANQISESVYVTLEKNYVKNSNEDIITIASMVTIDGGDGYTIDANNVGGIFNITSTGYLTLNNVKLINGNSDNGGAIYNQGRLLVVGGMFVNNTVSGNGGAIYHNGVSLTISGSTHFESNSARNGGAVYNDGSSTTIRGSIFINNKASNEGGAIYNNKPLTVSSHNVFTNNTAVNGGAIYNNNQLTIDGTNSFDKNKATGDGGAIYNGGSLFAINSATPFVSNVAGGKGGAIYNVGSTFSAEGFTFTNNTATVSGGAIYTEKDLTIKSTGFNSNKVTGENSQGAAISVVDAKLIIEDSTFTENVADNGAGIIYVSGNTASIKGSSFRKNEVKSATLYFNNTQATLIDSIFEENDIGDDWEVYANNSALTLSNNTIGNETPRIILINGAYITSEIKIKILENETVTICNDTAIINATVTDDNGNIIYDNSNVMFVINNEDVVASYNETLNLYQVTYHLPGSGIYLVNATYYNKAATVQTGVIKNINATFTDLQIKVNGATDTLELTYDFTYNGVIDDYNFTNGISLNKTLTINANGHSITSNGVNRIFNITEATTLNDITLINGSADIGGAIYNTATLTINNAIFKNNNATTLGGAIYNEGTLTITNSLFNSNKVTTASNYAAGINSNGGAAIFTQGSISVSGSNFTANTAPRDTFGKFTSGGAIYIYKATGALIDDCLFDSNVAGLGGAVMLEEYSQDTVTIKDSVFNNNNAWQGAAVNVNEGTGNITIIGSNFTYNTATEPNLGGKITDPIPSSGGAIMIGTMSSNATTVSISNSLFEKNVAVNGGAITISTKLVSNITNCNFTDNTVSGAGSAIMSTGSGINVDKSSFTLNTGGLGVIYLHSNSVNNISNSNFKNNNVQGGWDIANVGNLSLYKNNISNTSAGIISYGSGQITSKINITILNNKTVIVSDYNVTINATVTDDNGNIIDDRDLYFVINNEKVLASYKSSLKMYQAKYTLPSLGLFPVNASYYNNESLNIKTGAIKNIKGTYTDLQYKINNLTDNSVLNLTYNFTYTQSIDGDNFANGVLISSVSNLTINGNGYSINGNKNHRIFIITAPVTLNNITFVNGNADGGAINIDGANVIITNSKFINNTANDGGAIVFNKNLTIIGSEFINNAVPTSGSSYGGAIFSNSAGNLNIIGSKFKGNNATFGGAINLYNANMNAVIKDSEFIDNYAGGSGGALYFNSGTLTINNTNFTSNEGSYSGAIYFSQSNGVINNSKFTNNKARENNGGAINFASGKLNVSNSIFEGNTANSVSKAIYAEGGELSLKGNTINKDVAEIVLTNSAKIVSYLNITIIGNTTVDAIETTVNLNASIVDDEGNLINAIGFKFTLTGLDAIDATYNPTSKLYEATKTIPEKVAVYDVNVTYDGNDNLDNYIGILRNIKGTFTDLQNKINDATDKLELTYNFTYSPIVDNGGIIINKTITIDGKGFTIDANKNSINIITVNSGKSLVLNNTILTGVKGSTSLKFGAVVNHGSLTVDNTTFVNNSISKVSYANGGAAIFNDGTSLIIIGSKFINNTAPWKGSTGAISSWASGGVSIKDSYFEANSARFGGAIEFEQLSQKTLAVENCTFFNNTAYVGAGINVNDGASYLNITNCTFDSNSFKGPQGAPTTGAMGAALCVGVNVPVTLEISNSIIKNNYGDNTNGSSGAGIRLADKASGIITNCTFENNYGASDAAISTGTINNDAATVVIKNSTFKNNNATDNVSVMVGANIDANITDSVFDDISKYVIYNIGTLTLKNNTISGDSAKIKNVNGKIISTINVTILEGKVKEVDVFNVNLTAKVTDDNGNLIEDGNFNFTINNEEVKAVYNATSKLYEANYTLHYAGIYPVNITYITDNELNVTNATIKETMGTFTDLQHKIGNATGELTLSYNFIYFEEIDGDNFPNGIKIDKDIKINGNGSVISGFDAVRIFNVTSGTLTLNNLTITQGNASKGAGVYVSKEAFLVLNNTIFFNNTATYYGGAVYVDGNINVTGSVFDSNDIATKGSAYSEYGGSAIYATKNNSIFNIVGSNVTNNIKGGDYGSWLVATVMTVNGGNVTDCIFANNSAAWGGALAVLGYTGNSGAGSKGKLTVVGSKFVNNTAYYGAGVSVQWNIELYVDNCEFVDNKVSGKWPYDGDWSSGSAIYASDKVTLLNSEFINNYDEYNAAVYLQEQSAYPSVHGDSLIKNCTFEDNVADSYYGAVRYTGTKSLTVLDSHFINNTAKAGDYKSAGALFYGNSNGNLIVNNTEFVNNSGVYGGAISFYGSSLIVNNSNFTNNVASKVGGAININMSSDASISNSIFESNNAGGVVNAIYMYDGNLILSKNNISKINAEIVNVNGEILSALNITVMSNETYSFHFDTIKLNATVTDDNGNLINDKNFNFTIGDIANVTAVYNESAKIYEANYTPTQVGTFVVNVSYVANDKLNVKTATVTFSKSLSDIARMVREAEDGALITLDGDYTYIEEFDKEIVNGIVINKTITIDGKGFTISGNNTARLFNVTAGKFTIKNATLVNASAINGAVIYASSEVVVEDCIFVNNTASKKGGAIYSNSSLTISDSVFENNTISQGCSYAQSRVDCNGGGAIFISGSLTVSGSNFTNNIAPRDSEVFSAGGAIYISGAHPTLIDDCVFNNNSATYSGAVMFENFTQDSVAVKDSVFNNNKAWQGGAIYGNDLVGSLIIFGSNFTGNAAVTPNAGQSSPCGGAIIVGTKSYEGIALEVSGCNFVNNSAVYIGGAIDVAQNNKAVIINSNFTNNSATLGGAVDAGVGSNLTVVGSNFINNTASSMGDAIFSEPSSNSNISYSNFTSRESKFAVLGYQANLELFKNNVSGPAVGIYNYGGHISSETKIIILNNDTVTVHEDSVNLTANVTDDNGNLIKDTTFKFVINGTEVNAVYNATLRVYTGKFTLPKYGIYLVNITSANDSNLTIKTGVIKNIKGTFTDLQRLINENEDGKLTLQYNFTNVKEIDGDNFTNGVLIKNAIVIDGNGSNIDAKGVVRVFNITNNKSLTLKNMTITNANASNGAGVYVNKGASLVADYVKFINNTAKYRGGAIYSEGTVKVNNSVFDLNDITFRSGAASDDNGGAAIFNLDGNLDVNNSKFTNNIKYYVYQKVDGSTGDYIDGAITGSGSNVIDNSVFANNSARFGADVCILKVKGATSSSIVLNITNSNLTNARSYAGGIYVEHSTVLVSNSSFEGYVAGGAGSPGYSAAGGVICAMGGSILNVDNSTFINNTAPKAGAILAQKIDSITITNSKFINNTATGTGSSKTKGYGGAVLIEYLTGESSIDKSVFINNAAVNGGAVGIVDNRVTIKNSNFTNNRATNGSAIFNNGTLELSKNNVTSDGAEIVSVGEITSTLNITVMNNETYSFHFDTIKLNATVTDDNGNLVNDKNFNFTIGDIANITAVYNESVRIYEATYTPTQVGTFVVNVSYLTNDKLNVKTATVTFSKSLSDIARMVREAHDGDTINLTGDYTYIEEFDKDIVNGIVINKNITINAKGFTISGNNTARLFNVTAGNTFTLINATITNANATNGAGVYVNKGAKFVADYVNFTNNTATNRGGAIYSEGFVDINNAVFDSNDVTNRTKNVDNGGASIFNLDGNLKVNNSVFANNLKDYVISGTPGKARDLIDGVVISSGNAAIYNSNFTNNSGCYGGAITAIPLTGSSTGTIVIDNCNFTNNTAYDGGAMYIGWDASFDFNITNTYFENNLAIGVGSTGYTAAGGALNIIYNSGKGLISNCTFINNTARDGATPSGSAVSVESMRSLTIDGCNFVDNDAATNGGAIDISNGKYGGSTVVISNSNFTNNNAGKLGGAVYADGTSKVTIMNSNFTGNTANNGSAIYSAGTLELSKNNITSGEAEIVSIGKITSTINVTVLQNTTYTHDNFTVKLNATVKDDNGNLIHDINFNFTIDGKQVKAVYNETSKQYGANHTLSKPGFYSVAVSYIANDKLVVYTGTIKQTRGTYTDLQNKLNHAGTELNLEYNFTYNKEIDAGNFTNGMNITDHDITINGNGFTISGNNSYRIFNITKKVTLNNITFANGVSSLFGGAIYSTANLVINNSVFKDNDLNSTSTSDFGGYAIYTNANLTVLNSNFTNNGANYQLGHKSYGAIFMQGNGTFDNCIFTNNAGRWGGAIGGSGDGSGTISINNSKFENNKAHQGGAVAAQKYYLIVDNSTFNGNDATDMGGAISHSARGVNSINATIMNSVFDSNSVTNYGSAISAIASFNYINCNFTNNKAPTGTAVIHYYPTTSDVGFDNSTITDCIFENNSALYYGAIYFYSNKELSVKNSKFIDDVSSVTDRATGAITFYGKKLTVENTLFDGNKAGIAGGAIAVWGGNASIIKSNFTNNNASGTIKAIYIYSSGNVTIKDSIFENNGNNTNYAIYNAGILSLENNTVDNIIYNDGIITSTINATFINNATVNVTLGDTVIANATLVDDKGNAIYDPLFRIAVKGNNIENITYDKQTRLYTAEYLIVNGGDNIVNTTTYEAKGLEIYKGIYQTAKANVTLNITVEDIVFGENATVQIRLVGINNTNLTGKVLIIVNNNETTIDVINGTGVLNVSGLTPGKYGAVVSFEATDDYNSKINSTVFFVKSETKITVIVENITYGEDAVVNVTITYGDDEFNLTSGVVVVNINGTEYNVIINNGKGSTLVSGLAAGNNYNATAVYNTTDYYYTSNASDLFNVSKYTPTINVTSIEVTYPADVIVTVVSDVTGQYNVTVGNTSKVITLNANIAQDITFSNLAANTTGYLINVTYILVDTQNYTGAVNDTESVIVNKSQSEVVIDDIVTVIYPNNVTVSYTSNATVTSIVITKGDETVTATIVNDSSSITISNIAAGSYNITITAGDENHTESSSTKEFTVDKYTPVINVTVEEVTYNASVVVKVTSDVAGTYTVKVGDESQTVTLEENTEKDVTFTGLAANITGYTVNVTYTETANYTGAVNDTKIAIINKAKTIVNITETVAGVYNTTNATIKVTLVNETTVTFNITGNGVEILNKACGELNETISVLGAGTYTLTIVSSETENYTGDSDTQEFTIEKASSSVIISPVTNVTYDELVNVSFAVNNITAVTYIVKAKDGVVIATTTISNVNATNNIILPVLNAGNYTIIITNTENDNYTASNATANFTVKKATPVINVTVSDVVYPENVILNITSDVSGYYTVKVGETSQVVNLNAGEYKLVTFPGLDANETGYIVNITIDESDNYNAAVNDTQTVKVFKASSNVTIEPITNVVYPSNVEVRYEVVNKTTLIVIVTNKDTNENITIPDSNITATKVIIGGLAAGNYSISINNTGNKNYNASFESAEFSISKYTPQITVTVTDVTYDANVTVSVTSDVSGKFNVSVGDNTQEVELEANAAKDVNFTGLKANEEGYIVNVTYTETENYTVAYNNESIVKVLKAASSVNITDIVNGTYKTTNATITVTYTNGTDITFNITGVKSGNLEDLEDTLAGLGAGEYTIIINNAGDENHTASNATAVFSIAQASSSVEITNVVNATYNGTVNVEYTINNLTTTRVVITKDGVEVTATVTDNANSLDIKDLAAGVYNITIFNDENDNYTASNTTALFEIYKAASSVSIDEITNVTYPNDVTVTYNIINQTGTPDIKIVNRETGDEIVPDAMTISNLTAGNYTITIINAANENYTESNASANFTVSKYTPQITVSVNDVTYNATVIVTVTVDVNGTYTIKVGENVNTTVINANTPTEIKFANLNANVEGYQVNVTFNGNDNYTSAYNDTQIVKVFKAASSVEITNIVNGTYKTVNATVEVTYANGTVKFNITKAGAEVVSGDIANLETALADLGAGEYAIVLNNTGDENHNVSSASALFNIAKAGTSVVIDELNNVTYGTNTTIKFTVVNETIVNWTISDTNGVIKSGSDNNINIELAAGNYTFTVLNNETENYTSSSATLNFTVFKASSSVVINPIANVTYGTNTTISFTVDNETEVTWTISNATGVVKSGSDNNINIGLNAGNYTFTVTNAGTDNITESTATLNFTVTKAASSIVINPIVNVTYGVNTTINFNVVNETSVSWSIYNETGYIIASGDDSNNISIKLDAGNYTVKIHNTETVNYESAFASANFTVTKAASSIEIAEITNVTYNNNITINFNVVNETSVSWSMFNETGYMIASGDDSNNISIKLDAGNYTVKIHNTETVNYESAFASANFTVFKAGSNITVSEFANVTYGSDLIINFTVVNQTGISATVYDLNDETVYKLGMEDITENGIIIIISGLNAGDYYVKIINDDDENITGSFVDVYFTILKATPQITVTPINVTYPGNVIVSVKSDVSGNYVVKLGTATQDLILTANETKNATFGGLDAGNYNVNVSYAANSNYEAASASANVSVYKINSLVEITPINNVTYPNAIEITYNVENATTVTITVLDADKNAVDYSINKDGKIIVSTKPGNYTINIANAGTVNVESSNATANFTINKVSEYTLNATSENVTTKQNATITVTLPSEANGKVIVKVNGTEYNATAENGKAVITVNKLAEGKYEANITYVGDSIYGASNTTVNITVKKIDDYSMNASSTSPVYGEDAVVTVNLPSDATGNVTVKSGTKTFNATVSEGKATIKVSDLASGDNTVSVTYEGDGNYTSKSTDLNIHVSGSVIVALPMTRGVDSGMDYQARLVNEYGAPAAGITLIFTVDGDEYEAVTDANGYASINADLDVGKYSVSISEPLSGISATSQVTIVPRIIGNSDLTMSYLENKAYTVRIIGDNGNPVGAGVRVTFNMAGKVYNVVTDASGYAKVSGFTNAPGTYTITASYHGQSVANKVVVNTLFISKKNTKVKKAKINKKGYLGISYNVGKYLKGKKISLKFQGKTYKAKVNNKGKVQLKIPKKVINKLKVGKKYKYTLIYKLDKINRYMKVYKTYLLFSSK